jgi:hypothetical protein
MKWWVSWQKPEFHFLFMVKSSIHFDSTAIRKTTECHKETTFKKDGQCSLFTVRGTIPYFNVLRIEKSTCCM